MNGKRFLREIIFISLFIILETHTLFAQGEFDMRKINFQGKFKYIISDMELSPDGKHVAISTTQGKPIYIWDWKNEEVVNTFEVNGYYAGPRITYSPDGKYLLLSQQFYIDFSPNKDRPALVEVMDLSDGKIIFRKNDVNSAAFVPGKDQLVTLEEETVKFYDLKPSNKQSADIENKKDDFNAVANKKTYEIEDAKNALAVSPDGKTLVIAAMPSKDDLKKMPKHIAKQAKQLKKQYIRFYDLQTMEQKYHTSVDFDIVYNMRFTKDGSNLMVYNVSSTKQGRGQQGYINFVDPASGEVKRVIIGTMMVDPDYKENGDGSLVGLTNVDPKFGSAASVTWYNANTGQAIRKFNVDLSFGQDFTDGKTYFVFLPDNETILVNYGTQIAYVKMK